MFGVSKPDMENEGWEMFGHPCLGKHHHKKHHHKKHHHKKDHHKSEEPKRGPLGFVKTKGFVFGEGVGFGFTQSQGAFIKTGEGEYLAISSGYD